MTVDGVEVIDEHELQTASMSKLVHNETDFFTATIVSDVRMIYSSTGLFRAWNKNILLCGLRTVDFKSAPNSLRLLEFHDDPVG